ncbi:MAG TPA: glutathione S-transferase family protein [Steroidobacteraceae bacterium]|jgi:glutathione S-transferase|nr:glutathione S-transferase family protein [Steroidobacteraceae bacterium]
MLELHDYMDSGNGYKIRLLLAQLGLPYRHIEVDIMRGESRTAKFLAINPNGRIPVLGLGDGQYLTESDAILWYLAEGTDYLPSERYARAQVLQWMFFEQYSHEPYVATPRYIMRHLAADDPRRAELPQRLAGGRAALTVMETHLREREYFVSDRYTIADIGLYAYTHTAEDGGLELAPFPRVRAWLDRVAAQPRYVGLFDRPARL